MFLHVIDVLYNLCRNKLNWLNIFAGRRNPAYIRVCPSLTPAPSFGFHCTLTMHCGKERDRCHRCCRQLWSIMRKWYDQCVKDGGHVHDVVVDNYKWVRPTGIVSDQAVDFNKKMMIIYSLHKRFGPDTVQWYARMIYVSFLEFQDVKNAWHRWPAQLIPAISLSRHDVSHHCMIVIYHVYILYSDHNNGHHIMILHTINYLSSGNVSQTVFPSDAIEHWMVTPVPDIAPSVVKVGCV